jgi:glutamine cyclotransferase
LAPAPQATEPSPISAAASTLDPASAPAGPETTPVYGYKIINTYPHDRSAFTQGLVFDNGVLYESTGLNGRSSLRKVELETGRVLQRRDLPDEYFGEGLVLWRNKLIQLTWLSSMGFVYDKVSFEQLETFYYPGEILEGWGITHDGTRLMMSDGTDTIHFLNPETFGRIGGIRVRDRGALIDDLNELEYVKGEIYANVWLTDRIARISPPTGRVVGWIDLTGLLSEEDRAQHLDVLNGVAYDAEHDRLFVTGKLWPKLFEIQLVPK